MRDFVQNVVDVHRTRQLNLLFGNTDDRVSRLERIGSLDARTRYQYLFDIFSIFIAISILGVLCNRH